MKSLLAKLNLARLIILFSIIGSSYLGWTGWERYQEVKFLRGTFDQSVPALAKEIQELSLLNSKLHRDIKGDRYLTQASPESYVRYCANNPAAEIGEVTTDLAERAGRGGVIDNKITIRPKDSKREYSHAEVAAFLYLLEKDSNQIKVTSINYRLQGKNIKDDEIPRDAWTFDAVITNRVKDTSSTAKPNTVN